MLYVVSCTHVNSQCLIVTCISMYTTCTYEEPWLCLIKKWNSMQLCDATNNVNRDMATHKCMQWSTTSLFHCIELAKSRNVYSNHVIYVIMHTETRNSCKGPCLPAHGCCIQKNTKTPYAVLHPCLKPTKRKRYPNREKSNIHRKYRRRHKRQHANTNHIIVHMHRRDYRSCGMSTRSTAFISTNPTWGQIVGTHIGAEAWNVIWEQIKCSVYLISYSIWFVHNTSTWSLWTLYKQIITDWTISLRQHMPIQTITTLK